MNNTQHYVYLYTDPSRGEPIYVGMGQGRRLTKHLTRADRHPMTHRLQLMKRNGVAPVIVKIAEGLDAELASLIEQEVIAKWGRRDLGKGTLLNLTDGGDGCNNPSAESRAKMSASHTGLKQSAETIEKRVAKLRGVKRPQHVIDAVVRANTGATRSEESRKRMSKAQRGKVLAEEHRLKISNGLIGHIVTYETRTKISDAVKGYTHSADAKARMSETRRGRPSVIKGRVQEQIICTNCGKSGGKSIMRRWHFEKCGVIHGK